MQIRRMRQHGHFVVEIRMVDEKREVECQMNLVLNSGKNEFSGKARNPGATHFGACTTAGTSYPAEIKRNSKVVAFPKIS